MATSRSLFGQSVSKMLSKGLDKPRVMRESCGLAFLLVWYDTAFRISNSPAVQIPIKALDYPRQDIGWLCGLLTVTCTCIIMGCWHLLKHHGTRQDVVDGTRHPGKAAPTFASLVTSLGSAVFIFGSSNPTVASLGGVLAGLGFALQTASYIQAVSLSRARTETAQTAIWALGIAAAVKLILLLLSAIALRLLVCLLPPLATMCLMQRRYASDKQTERPGTNQSRATRLNHTVTVLFCFFGLGLFMGIIGFHFDSMPSEERTINHLATSSLGAAIGFLALLASKRVNPDGPFVITPVMLGTAALMLPFAQSSFTDAANTLGKAVDDSTFVLAFICYTELVHTNRETAPHILRAKVSLLVGAIAGIHIAGILAGGILVNLTGLDATALALVGASLIYLAMLALGITAQQKGREGYIIVRNPQDAARIASAQARAIANDFPELSQREIDVLELLLQHQTTECMAETLGISRNTVKSHISHLYAKTGLNSRQQLVNLAATKTVALD